MVRPVIYVRVKRPNGDTTELVVHQSKLQEVMDAANNTFGTPERILGGPKPGRVKSK
jgi:hypothetical protein